MDVVNSYRWIVGFALPIAILVISTLGKKLARGPGWKSADFFVIDQLSLAAMADSASSIIAAHRPDRRIQPIDQVIWGDMLIIVLAFVFFILGQSIWQDYGPENTNHKPKSFVKLVMAADLVGFLTLAGASLLLAA